MNFYLLAPTVLVQGHLFAKVTPQMRSLSAHTLGGVHPPPLPVSVPWRAPAATPQLRAPLSPIPHRQQRDTQLRHPTVHPARGPRYPRPPATPLTSGTAAPRPVRPGTGPVPRSRCATPGDAARPAAAGRLTERPAAARPPRLPRSRREPPPAASPWPLPAAPRAAARPVPSRPVPCRPAPPRRPGPPPAQSAERSATTPCVPPPRPARTGGGKA